MKPCLFVCALALIATGLFAEELLVEKTLKKAAKYLWNQQAEDGGWHSETYALLRSGQALTPFVLKALLQVPEELYPREPGRVDKALAFIRKYVDKDGALGLSDPLLSEYPNYASALAIIVLCRAGRMEHKDDRALIDRMVARLVAQQFKGEWEKTHEAYGAWGFGALVNKPPLTGHVDLSMTRYALEALRVAAPANKRGAYEAAEVYLERSQNFDAKDPKALDGGFFFSTVIPALNKAGHDGKRFRSYGTATADGILSLLAAGVALDDARVNAAAQWLNKHHQGGGVPGVPLDEDKAWDVSIRFYYAMVSAEAFTQLGIKPAGEADWRKPIVEFLVKAQGAGGSFTNNNVLMKEDDPLISTPMAVEALVRVR